MSPSLSNAHVLRHGVAHPICPQAGTKFAARSAFLRKRCNGGRRRRGHLCRQRGCRGSGRGGCGGSRANCRFSCRRSSCDVLLAILSTLLASAPILRHGITFSISPQTKAIIAVITGCWWRRCRRRCRSRNFKVAATLAYPGVH